MGAIPGLYGNNGKSNGNYRDCRGYVGVEFGGYIGIMEKEMGLYRV